MAEISNQWLFMDIASHLFYSYTIDEWCWAEQPFYNVNAIRNDGALLILTFLKEQEFVGWSHYITNGAFNSTASVTEPTDHAGTIDAVYVAVERTIKAIPSSTSSDLPNAPFLRV